MPFDFKTWYAEHGDDLNRRRRERYRGDQAYRQQVLQTNEGTRERKREQDDAVRREGLRETVEPHGRRWKTQEMEVGGEVLRLYSIGSVARILGYSVQIVRKWEREGRLPPAAAKNAKGDRMFSLEQLQLIRELAKRQGMQSSPRYRVRVVRFVVRLAGGEEVVTELFRVGEMAKAIRRAVLTIGQMERTGIMPITPLRYGGKRLYTAGMVQVASDAMAEQAWKLRGRRAGAFYAAVLSGWSGQGVVGASVVRVEGTDDGKEDQDGGEGAGGDAAGPEVLRGCG